MLSCTDYLPYDSSAQSFSKFPEPDGAIFWTTDTILLIVWQNNASYTASVAWFKQIELLKYIELELICFKDSEQVTGNNIYQKTTWATFWMVHGTSQYQGDHMNRGYVDYCAVVR